MVYEVYEGLRTEKLRWERERGRDRGFKVKETDRADKK